MSSWSEIEAEKAFSAAARARRRASLARRLRGRGDCARLAVHDERALRRTPAGAGLGLREISLDAITATLEPNRVAQFDRDFRPAPPVRARWQSVWMAEQRGAVLRRSRSSRSATGTRSATAITASPSPARAARSPSTRSSAPRWLIPRPPRGGVGPIHALRGARIATECLPPAPGNQHCSPSGRGAGGWATSRPAHMRARGAAESTI